MSTTPSHGTESAAYRTYVLAALGFVAFMHNVDKVVIYMFMQPIKAEFGLTDTQVGLISGAAFAITSGLIAIPVARLADRRSRRWIIGASFGIWSLFTALCGASVGFLTLLLARIGVGAGESGTIPATHSMLGDYYPRALRARALGIIAACMSLGGVMGMISGGLIAQTVGWRQGFFILGGAGVLMAVVFHLTVREPARPALPQERDHSIQGMLRELGDLRSFAILALALGLAAFTGAAVAWLPSYFTRTYSLAPLQVGLGLGLSIGTPFALGTVLGGHFSMRHVAQSKSWALKFGAVTLLIGLPFYIACFFAPSALMAFGLLFLSMLIIAAPIGSLGVVLQDMVSSHARATAQAVVNVMSSVIGAGLGPVLIGVISDWVQHVAPEVNSLRVGLIAVGLPLLATSALYWLLAKRIDASVGGSSPAPTH